MKNKNLFLAGISGVTALFLLIGLIFYISTSNSISKSNNAVQESWENVQSQYTRRADLLEQLIPVVKEASRSESETLEKAIRARYVNATPSPVALQESEGEISNALTKLLSVTENYPNLKSQDNYQNLMAQIEGSENRIAVSRTEFNKRVRDYNDIVTTFPGSTFGKERKTGFTMKPGDDSAPQINFGGN